MGRTDKFLDARMSGMMYVLEYAKKNGLEEAEKEMKRRGYTGLPLTCTDAQMQNTIRDISENVYTMMLTAMLYAAHEAFGFGKDRLFKLRDTFNQLVENTYDLDYMSCHYITMADYAEELREKYDILTDLTRIQRLQSAFDKTDNNYRMCKVDRVLEELKNNGFESAAEFLEKKLS